ncbi:MAG: hypothetical protein J6Y20_12830, partial [Lachnospiraceae bacterium]|nr:hypothetical protein [Lachnospiraceae bacterium]
MKSSDEMINDLFKRRDQYTEDKKRKRAARMRILIPVCAPCCVLLLGFGVWKSGLLRRNPGTNNGGNMTGQTTVTPGETNNTPAPTEANNTPTPTVANNTPTPTDIPLELDKSQELTASSSGAAPETKKMDDTMRTAYETFAYKLFAQLPEGESRKMISPFSIYVALSMLADGADGDTLAQLDALLGLTAEERNAYLAGWIQDLETIRRSSETMFTNADSVWINEKLKSNVPKDFLDICAQYYKSAVFSTPMDDSTVEGINAWAKAKTADMIDEIIEELDPYTVMVLMNA